MFQHFDSTWAIPFLIDRPNSKICNSYNSFPLAWLRKGYPLHNKFSFLTVGSRWYNQVPGWKSCLQASYSARVFCGWIFMGRSLSPDEQTPSSSPAGCWSSLGQSRRCGWGRTWSGCCYVSKEWCTQEYSTIFSSVSWNLTTKIWESKPHGDSNGHVSSHIHSKQFVRLALKTQLVFLYFSSPSLSSLS